MPNTQNQAALSDHHLLEFKCYNPFRDEFHTFYQNCTHLPFTYSTSSNLSLDTLAKINKDTYIECYGFIYNN